MTTHQMQPPLINEFIPEVTTVLRLVLLYLSGLHNSQNILLSFTDMLRKNPELILNTPDFAEDFDSLICLACTMANAPIFTTARS